MLPKKINSSSHFWLDYMSCILLSFLAPHFCCNNVMLRQWWFGGWTCCLCFGAFFWSRTRLLQWLACTVMCHDFHSKSPNFHSAFQIALGFLSLGNIHILQCHINFYPSSASQNLFVSMSPSHSPVMRYILSLHLSSLSPFTPISSPLLLPLPAIFRMKISPSTSLSSPEPSNHVLRIYHLMWREKNSWIP